MSVDERVIQFVADTVSDWVPRRSLSISPASYLCRGLIPESNFFLWQSDVCPSLLFHQGGVCASSGFTKGRCIYFLWSRPRDALASTQFIHSSSMNVKCIPCLHILDFVLNIDIRFTAGVFNSESFRKHYYALNGFVLSPKCSVSRIACTFFLTSLARLLFRDSSHFTVTI